MSLVTMAQDRRESAYRPWLRSLAPRMAQSTSPFNFRSLPRKSTQGMLPTGIVDGDADDIATGSGAEAPC